MNILVLSGSPRKGGNTDLLVEAFVKGASQKHYVEVVSVRDYKVNPCMGCNACFRNEQHTCAQKPSLTAVIIPSGIHSALRRWHSCLLAPPHFPNSSTASSRNTNSA